MGLYPDFNRNLQTAIVIMIISSMILKFKNSQKKGQIAIQRHETSKDEKNLVLWEENELSKKTITEFDKMVSFCRKKNISLVVVTAPVPQETLKHIVAILKKQMRFLRNLARERCKVL